MEETVTIPRLLTVREVAEALRCSKQKVYGLIYAGTLPTAKIAGKTLCRATDIETYITNCLKASGLEDNDAEDLKPAFTSTEQENNATLLEHRRNKRLMLS